MRFMRENPVYSRVEYHEDRTNTATYMGVVGKTFLLLLIVAVTAYTTALNFGAQITFGQLLGGLVISPIAAIIMVIMAHRMTHVASIFAFLYALFEGVFLGLLTLFVYAQTGSDGVIYALTGTFGTLFVMLFLYSTRIIKVNAKLRSFLFTALISVFFMGLLNIVFIFTWDGYLYSNFYLTVVLVSVLISTLYLLNDFDRIEHYVTGGASKDHEWSLSLGLVTTIVWLYIEMLRLVLALSRRR